MDIIELSAGGTQHQVEIARLASIAGVELSSCYQCGKCSAGCPEGFAMDESPRRIIRLLQLGLLSEALQARSIWLCAACDTCSTRCPKGVDIAALMETLRQEAKRKALIRDKNIHLFHELFLTNVKWFGRSPEVILSAMYNLMSGNLFQDMDAAAHFFKSGKAHFLPRRIKNTQAIRQIFQRCLEKEEPQ